MEPLTSKPKRQTIFLVDDLETNLLAGRDALQDVYDVYTFDSGARMLKVLEKLTCDLILLDIKMPEMDGYEILAKLKDNALTASIPVIFLTSLSNEEDEAKGLSLGAADYIMKPFSQPLLKKRIKTQLTLVNYNNNLQAMVEEKTKAVIELKNIILKTVAELIDCRDTVSVGHAGRIQSYMEVFMNAMKKYDVYGKEIASYDEQLVLLASTLHDVGKILLREPILLKPGKLSETEYNEMKLHTTFGEKIISRINETVAEKTFLEYVGIFAVSHHEKWDGSGYPKGLSGGAIPLLGRIIAIADTYDALISERVYKEAFTHNEAVRIISLSKGLHFDPVLADLFAEINSEFEKIGSTANNT